MLLPASHWVAWSVGLSVALSVCHTSEPCKNGWNDQVAILRCGLGWAQWTTYYMRSRCQHGKGQFWGRNKQTIVNNRHTPRSSVQRRLNRSRCRLGWTRTNRKHHVLHGRSRSPMGRGNSDGQGRPLQSIGTFSRKLCINGCTYPFAVSVVDSSGPKDAQVQSYSPGGSNVPLWKDTLPSPVE